MSRPSFPGSESDRHYSNADSFAAAFDEAWRQLVRDEEGKTLSRLEKLERVLGQLNAHPFAQMDATRAREVGEFRIRLLGL